MAARRAPLFGGGFGDAGTDRSVVEVPVFWKARVAPFKAAESAALGGAEGFAPRVWDGFCMDEVGCWLPLDGSLENELCRG